MALERRPPKSKSTPRSHICTHTCPHACAHAHTFLAWGSPAPGLNYLPFRLRGAGVALQLTFAARTRRFQTLSWMELEHAEKPSLFKTKKVSNASSMSIKPNDINHILMVHLSFVWNCTELCTNLLSKDIQYYPIWFQVSGIVNLKHRPSFI